mmetsp:Transcript_34834/g.56003  ORF Transcript_34834/g.56003 Transcript_34834/m.56003 type:complete len:223 (-) Transcript_34834:459-1127(-)
MPTGSSAKIAHFDVSVAPVSSRGFFLLVPDTKHRCTRPTSAFCRSPAVVRNASMTSDSRLSLTSSGTSSTSFRAADVPARSLYANMNACSYPTLFIRLTVSACSSSVSPQKPAIMSVVMAQPGMISLTRAMRLRYASRVYPRAMRSRVVVDPDCAGMCRHAHTLGRLRITSSTASGKSFGCGDVNRTRISGSTAATRSSSAANCMDPSRRGAGAYRDENPAA